MPIDNPILSNIDNNPDGAMKALPDRLLVRDRREWVPIMLADITLVEGLDDYLKIHTVNQKKIVVRMTMKAFLEQVPDATFIRVHRSYIIPISRVEEVKQHAVIVAGMPIPIGGRYEEDFLIQFKK